MKKKLIRIFGLILIVSIIGYILGRSLWGEVITDDIGDYFLWVSGICALLLVLLSMSRIIKLAWKIRMKLNLFFGLLTIVFGVFGYWGVFTEAGNRQYDEMAGIIPGFALLMACFLLFCLLVINVSWWLKVYQQKVAHS